MTRGRAMTRLVLALLLAIATLVPAAGSCAQQDCDQSPTCSGGLGHQTTPKAISGNQLIYKYDMDYFGGVVRDAGERCSSIGRKMQIVGNPNCGGPYRVLGCPYCPLYQDCVATFECR